MQVKLEEWELKILGRLAKMKDFTRYLENRFRDWGDLETMTAESFASRKDAISLVKEALYKPVLNHRDPKEAPTNREYE